MKKYYIENQGCDDTTEFYIDLTDDELKTVIKLFEANNKEANYGCKPDLYIYVYDENKSSWEYTEPLNKSHNQLIKED